MASEALDDAILYLRDEGLDEQQIEDFVASHDLHEIEDEDEIWEIVESHIFRETDISQYSE
jgi:hypothetical protein